MLNIYGRMCVCGNPEDGRARALWTVTQNGTIANQTATRRKTEAQQRHHGAAQRVTDLRGGGPTRVFMQHKQSKRSLLILPVCRPPR